MSKKSQELFRMIHRYLGFFLAGIMAVYAISGIVLTFRNTDAMKREVAISKMLDKGLQGEAIGSALQMRGFKIEKTEGAIVHFPNGTYNSTTGEANYTVKRLPIVLEKMNKLHKMHSGNPLFWLAIFFGIGLLFFAVSAFFMFKPDLPIYKRGLYFAAAGIALTIILMFV